MYSIRVMTFNIRGCRGVDGKVDPARIAAAIEEGQPDIVALQEVVTGASPDHLAILGDNLGMEIFGDNLDRGNAFLSRFPLRGLQEHDLGGGGVCLRADADIHGKRLHLFNIHLQAFPFPRRRQIVSLMSTDLVRNADLVCPKVILGDFADPWFGMGTMELFLSLRAASPSFWRPTFPSRFPVFFPGSDLLPGRYCDSKLQCLKKSRNQAGLLPPSPGDDPGNKRYSGISEDKKNSQ